MKVIPDSSKNAYNLLKEVHCLVNRELIASEWLAPYGPEAKKNYPSLPTYIMAGKEALANSQLANFDANYPTIKEVLANGESVDDGGKRLHDAIYKLGAANASLSKANYLVKLDAERTAIREQLLESAGDLIIYLIVQYELDKSMDGEVKLSVNALCEKEGITPAVLYGELLNQLEHTGVQVYGYESISKWNEQLLDIDPVFVAECEENNFPLTEDICQQICEGKLPIPEARNLLASFLRESEEKEVDGITPTNMIARLNLE